MADHPMLFSGPMVRALLNGSKTQTRRLFKPQPEMHQAGDCTINGHRGSLDYLMREIAPKHWLRIKVGDRLWVRETWCPLETLGPWDVNVLYLADNQEHLVHDGEFGDRDWTWPKAAAKGSVPSIHMPRWASRLTLTVTDVRVERVQDISEADCIAEGIVREGPYRYSVPGEIVLDSARSAYLTLLDTINGVGFSAANPWVAAYTFTVQRGNIDRLERAA